DNPGATLVYSWTGPGGFTSTDETPTVTVAGIYTLRVTDADNGCFATDTVEVKQDITAPVADAGGDLELTCATTSVQLNGSGSSTNPDADLEYLWTGPGEFTSTEESPTVTVAGIYTLRVTDADNGCYATDTVEVKQDITAPVADAGGDLELTCTTTSVQLNGSGSSTNPDADLEYLWTGPGGFTSTDETPTVTVAGIYTLTVTDSSNGCYATDTVEVKQDITAPLADAGGDLELTCATTSVQLN